MIGPVLICSYFVSSWGVIPNTSISRIWKSFIPFSTFGVFQRGGYFIVDVIPDQLAVISLNTIYFYDSNKGT